MLGYGPGFGAGTGSGYWSGCGSGYGSGFDVTEMEGAISMRMQTRREGGNIVDVVVVPCAGIRMQSMRWVVDGDENYRSRKV